MYVLKKFNFFFFLTFSYAFICLGLISAFSIPAPKYLLTNDSFAKSKKFQDVSLTNPLNGATNVPVNTSMSWNASNIVGVAGYILNIGTSPGGTDIASNLNVGLATSYTPPLGLPENSTIYVTISLFFLNAPSLPCPEEQFTTEDITTPPQCTQLNNPLNGQTNVPVGTLLRWQASISAEGYRISIGTSPGASDISSNLNLGNTLSYKPLGNLPPNSLIYVRLVPYNSNGDLAPCPEESFMTTELPTQLPSCTNLVGPIDGQTGVPLSSVLSWNAVGNATGYRMTVGSSPFDDDILANVDLGNETSLSFLNFVANTFVFVTITPYNDVGDAIGCVTESFSTIIGCGPYLDPATGETIFLGPELDFPDQIGICLDNIPTSVDASTEADGFRWFEKRPDGSELLVSTEQTLDLFREGDYRLEAFNTIADSNLECSIEQNFTVISSEAPTITATDIVINGINAQVTIEVSGIGDYEYALNNRNGPYQDSQVFNINLKEANTVFVRDKNGCGMDERFLNTGFPNFFTPNGDNINDLWQIPGAVVDGEAIVAVHIFDRFGKLLVQLDPQSAGWDGNYTGQPMPEGSYWYKIQVESGKILKGYFALKR